METITIRHPNLQPASLFPKECQVRWSEPLSLVSLEHKSESDLAVGWAPKVQDLYTAGRLAAHQALGDLGAENSPIGRGEDGAPIWPQGTVGSITHTAGIALAVVGATSDVLALGIDVEKEDRSLQLGLIDRVASQEEGEWIREKEDEAGFRLLCLLSAKEAVFKAVCSLSGIRLGFMEASLEGKEGGFDIRILHPRLSKEWGSLKFFLRQGLWKGYLISGLCLRN